MKPLGWKCIAMRREMENQRFIHNGKETKKEYLTIGEVDSSHYLKIIQGLSNKAITMNRVEAEEYLWAEGRSLTTS